MSMYRDYKVRGVLSCPGVDENTKELYEQYPVPYMFIGRTPKGFNCHSVQMNPFSICVNMAEHLVENGYTHFAYAGLAEIKPVEDLRLFGYKSGVNAAGFELVKESVLSVSAKEVTQAPGKIRDFLSALPKPAAVFCYHDLLALEFYKAAVSLGLSVPEDVGIAGFDNLFATTCATPPITTVDYRLEKMVEIAFERLTKQIQTGKYDKLNYFIEPKLMIRGSTQRTS